MKKRNIVLRPATIEDCRDIFEIISDPSVRLATFKQKLILWDEHQRWLQLVVKSSDRLLFIIEDDEINILGMLRFDIQHEHANVSIALNKVSRGFGYGKLALQMGCDEVYQKTGVTVFCAYVKNGNTPSCKVFTRAGFIRNGTTQIDGKEADIFVYTITNSESDSS